MIKSLIISISILFGVHEMQSQADTIRVLFLGNSYTQGNNLPQLVEDLSTAEGKTLITNRNTPGGHTLDGHSTNTSSLQKIRQGNWDYVVLQEQSQIPTIDFYRYGFMYPAAERLSDSIKKYNPCANVVMFMTWGRQLGGQQCDGSGSHCSPVFMDFSHMQDSLESAYTQIADSINAYVAPVGISWKSVIEDTSIVLHTADQSHPNLNGSYLAACTFYATFWKEPVSGNTFTSGLSPSFANYLQSKADSVVFQASTSWNHDIDEPKASFTWSQNQDTVWFTNLSSGLSPMMYNWDFDDGSSSSVEHPVHVYAANGNYDVSLQTVYCNRSDSTTNQINIGLITQLENPKDKSSYIHWEKSNNDLIIKNLSQQDVAVALYDLAGRILVQFKCPAKGTSNVSKELIQADFVLVRVVQAHSKEVVYNQWVNF
jgi:PKD repeat protein